MKRSEINIIIEEAKDYCNKNNFKLPPFAFWSVQDWKNKDKLFNLLVKKSSDPRVVFNKMEELLKSYAEKATESLRKVKDSESKHNLEELVNFTEFKA